LLISELNKNDTLLYPYFSKIKIKFIQEMSLYYSYCYNVKRFRRLRILYQKKVMNPLYRS